MNLDHLNAKDARIRARCIARIKAIKEAKRTREWSRAAINEALKERDDARGNMLREFLK